MKKKFYLVLLLAAGTCGIISAHNSDKDKGNPGTETSKDGNAKSATVKPATGATVKPKVVKAPVKQSDTYENKAPSIFTFTVLSTYFNMPIQKK